MSRDLVLRECVVCHNTFRAYRNAQYCGSCKIDRIRELRSQGQQRRRAGKARELGSKDLCQQCGKVYVVESAQQKYCGSECADKGQREYFRLRYRTMRGLTIND